MNKNIVAGVSLGVALLLGILYLKSAQPIQVNVELPKSFGTASGPTHTELQEFYAGARVGLRSTGINQPLLNVVATTTSWNPGSLAAGVATTTEFAVSSTVTGFVRGFCQIGAFTMVSSTQATQFTTDCMFATSTVVLSIFNASTSQTLDIVTSTVTIYQFQF